MAVLTEHLDKADDIHTEETQVLTEINDELLEEHEKDRTARNREKREAIIKPRLLELVLELRISTKENPVGLENRYILEDIFDNFRTLVFDFILPLASAKRSTPFFCLNCWTIMFLRKDSLKSNPKYVKPGWIELRTLFHENVVEQHQPALNTFYSAMGLSEEEALERGPRMVTPTLTLPGDRIGENRGHQCHWEPEPEPRDVLCTMTKDTRGQTPEGVQEVQDLPPLQIEIPESPPPKPKKKTTVTPIHDSLGKRNSNSFEDETMDENKSQVSEEKEPTLQELFFNFDHEIQHQYDDFSLVYQDGREQGHSQLPLSRASCSDRPI